MTGDFTRAPDLAFPADRLRQAIVDAAGPTMTSFLDAGRLARALVGDAIGANLLLVGYAWQKGLIPLSREAIERAIEVNGVQTDFNRRAFLWGRRAAHDLAAVEAVIGTAAQKPAAPRTLDETHRPPRRVPDRLPGRGLRPPLLATVSRGSARSRPAACPAAPTSPRRSPATCSG